ncbi:hypothetical protein F0562_036097 [Nyssa sinensis]|uniref:Uncharacterized protein n=1 Tax=Nyssa sinensis TaxID=561372 RepID=A0A5J5AFX6_9ASTE|nr:hypothetical protein F0562_036097 [Nyssa sinensis]
MRTDLTTAGVTGLPNDDWCESHKAETTLTNVVGTLTPAELCREEGLILINYATGHIFEYDSTFVPVMIFGVVSGAGSISKHQRPPVNYYYHETNIDVSPSRAVAPSKALPQPWSSPSPLTTTPVTTAQQTTTSGSAAQQSAITSTIPT